MLLKRADVERETMFECFDDDDDDDLKVFR